MQKQHNKLKVLRYVMQVWFIRFTILIVKTSINLAQPSL